MDLGKDDADWRAELVRGVGSELRLLRKGGLLDPAVGDGESGTFTLEYSNFFLWPSHLHQQQRLVKTQHHDLFEETEAPRDIVLPLWARVERVWSLTPDDEEKLMQAPHIWSRDYLDVRFGYKPQSPLLCAALRVYTLPHSHVLAMQSKFGGCRSWHELDAPLSLAGAQPAHSDAAWKHALREVENTLK